MNIPTPPLPPCAYCAEPTPEPTTHQQDDGTWVCFDRPAWDWPNRVYTTQPRRVRFALDAQEAAKTSRDLSAHGGGS